MREMMSPRRNNATGVGAGNASVIRNPSLLRLTSTGMLAASTAAAALGSAATGATCGAAITGAPRIIKGKVIIGNGGAELGVRGYITAYDADTGRQLWRFYTVPGDPRAPVENEALKAAMPTWKAADASSWW